MASWCALLIFFCLLCGALSFRPRSLRPHHPISPPTYDLQQAPYLTYTYNQTLDHFNFFTQPQTYTQRYLVSTTYANADASCSPMIFYTGNEGDITWFYNNSYFVTDVLASELNAVVVYAEHRYYGVSLPFGADSFTQTNVAYLTSEQALADYAQLIPILKGKYNVWGCPVIAVGGSYGGMLAAWFRMKYPNIADAALAASAPILQFEGTGVTEEIYNEIITNDFAAANSQCPNAFREAFAASQNASLSQLTSEFLLCSPLDNTNDFVNWLVQGIGYMAMADYPYPANFLEPMPAWPVNLACQKILDPAGGTILQRLNAAISVYYNFTGEVQCFNTSVFMTSAASDVAWDYQACTEMVFPISANGINDMFPPAPFDLDQLTQYCQKTWGVTPRPDWIPTYFGGQNISAASNIIFSNGQLDPWMGGGVTKTINPTLYAILIEQGAHHLDLRAPNPLDPPSVIAARQMEIALLKKWLNLS
eukprot:Phypoly_transcript_08509.p1 GENE.Phypoly_transcript_08509~~Phypoly_transcript_08509.p1  ORF type:complete len:498 (+),score=83.60 Phypoly_transcript_08509:63-1496(+)